MSGNVGVSTIQHLRADMACGSSTSPPSLESVFTYNALADSEIRLLILEPGYLKDPTLRGTVVHEDYKMKSDGPSRDSRLTTEQKYECLSYTWGRNIKRCSIYMGGDELSIGENLYLALSRIRLPTRRRWLWVDAICINQEDEVEKTAQVKMMFKIFGGARNTISWVGEDSPMQDGKLFIEFLKWIGRTYETRRRKPPLGSDELIERFNARTHFPDVTLNPLTKEAVLAFLSRPYFRRRWIVPETKAGRGKLRCGESTIRWTSADHGHMAGVKTLFSRDAGLSYGMFSWYESDGHAYTLIKISWCGFSNKLHRPLEYLETFAEFGCKDPRDHVAALQPLWSSKYTGGTEIVVDYSQSIEWNYVLFASSQVELDLLWSAAQRTWDTTGNASGLPSWAPDWRIARRISWRLKSSMIYTVVKINESERSDNIVSIKDGILRLTV